jgi:type IV pilus assembly protein PilP
MRFNGFALSLLIVLAAMATVFAQTPGGRPGGAAPASTATTATTGTTTTRAASSTNPEQNSQQSLQEILEEPTSPDAYHYDPQGRRDPFQSLIGPAPRRTSGQVPGPPGFLIDEMKLQGIVKTRQQGLVAMVNGPDNKGYLLKVGDKVLDGEVVRITATSVVFRQEVNDPTRIERFREVVKDISPEKK